MSRTAIIGGGLAGLACAHALQARGAEWTLFEASDAVGGRVRTDMVDGFRLDRGFQVYLTGYRAAGELLDYAALRLRQLHAGAMVFDGRRFVDAGDVGDFGYFDKFSFAAWIKPRAGKDGTILSRMVEDQSDSAFASIDEGYRVFLKDGHVQLHLTKRWLDDALRVETEEQVPPDQWRHITVVYDGSRVAAGVKIFINGQPQAAIGVSMTPSLSVL